MHESQKEKIELKGAIQSLESCWRVLKNAQKRYRSSNRSEEDKQRAMDHYLKMAENEMYQFKGAMERIDMNKLSLDKEDFKRIIKGDQQI